jgi:hypothetical protein
MTACRPAGQLIKSPDSISYRVRITHPNLPEANQQIWQRGFQRRVETQVDGRETTVLIDEPKQLVYILPDSKTALQADFRTADRYPSATQLLANFYQSDAIINRGQETLNGYSVTRYERDEPGSRATFWVWEEEQFPIRSEVETPAGIVITNWSDMIFNQIPDTQLQLPPNATVIPVAELD